MNRLMCVAALCVALSLPVAAFATENEEARNTALVTEAFDNWKAGRGSLFDLLADDAEWTVAGTSPSSGTYRGRAAFMEQAVRPITERLATPIVPQVRHILAQGDHVVVIWDGTATAHDGSAYTNQYAWHLQLADGRITHVTAFLDTWALQQLMQ